jgi:BirA family transcriptional regulator, biotin operon repressor / biotin---[acetyl-CoA-carboxylase] ligase
MHLNVSQSNAPVDQLIIWGCCNELHCRRGQRLKNRFDLLDSRAILDRLDPRTRALIADVEVLVETDSTNSYLIREGPSDGFAGRVCLAETQTAGRGRRGKRWISPFGANLYMSLLWRSNQRPSDTARLSLLIAVAVADALTAMGARGLALKWPNDVLWRGKKLSGILLETVGATNGGHIVIGIGVNINMSEFRDIEIDQPWTDLATVLYGNVPSRNLLAARLLDAIVTTICSFERGGGKNLQHVWRRYDSIYGQVVEVQTHNGRQRGKALGIDVEGRLIIQIDGQRQAFACGGISLITISQRMAALE